jgi:hypothetical protein
MLAVGNAFTTTETAADVASHPAAEVTFTL